MTTYPKISIAVRLSARLRHHCKKNRSLSWRHSRSWFLPRAPPSYTLGGTTSSLAGLVSSPSLAVRYRFSDGPGDAGNARVFAQLERDMISMRTSGALRHKPANGGQWMPTVWVQDERKRSGTGAHAVGSTR